jgi:hypothetical protein
MLTKIVTNGLQRNNPDDLRTALAGIWGQVGDAAYFGRNVINWIYEGSVVHNPSSFPAMAIILFDDNTTEIRRINGGIYVDLGKEIAIAFVMAKTM